MIESGDGVGGECRDSLTRKRERESNAAQRQELIFVMKCSGRACCYYSSGCYCTKPKMDNEMMYGVLLSTHGVGVLVDVPFK